MKEMWEAPRIAVEEFAPNEYVSVCWGVQCDVTKSNKWEGDNTTTYDGKTYNWNQINTWDYDSWSAGTGLSHSADHCGTADNQAFIDYEPDNKADAMVEINTSGLNTLNCTFYTDKTFEESMSITDVVLREGQSVYWTTSSTLTKRKGWNNTLSLTRIWHHIGTIVGYLDNHPNRS